MNKIEEKHLGTCQPTPSGTFCTFGCPVLLRLQIDRLRAWSVASSRGCPPQGGAPETPAGAR